MAYIDGCCNTGPNDYVTYSVSAVIDNKFLKYSREMGNDLTIDHPRYNFKGLKAGEKWSSYVPIQNQV